MQSQLQEGTLRRVEQKIILERLAEAAAIAAGKPLKKPVPDWEW